MQELLDKARSLGEAIAAHERTSTFFAASAAVRGDKVAKSLLEEVEKQANRIRTLEMEQKPVEPADKHKLAELQTKVSGNDLLKTLMRTQADYIELMNQINNSMQAPLAEAQQNAG